LKERWKRREDEEEDGSSCRIRLKKIENNAVRKRKNWVVLCGEFAFK